MMTPGCDVYCADKGSAFSCSGLGFCSVADAQANFYVTGVAQAGSPDEIWRLRDLSLLSVAKTDAYTLCVVDESSIDRRSYLSFVKNIPNKDGGVVLHTRTQRQSEREAEGFLR